MNEDIELNDIYRKLQALLKSGKNHISVMEEQVDVEVQMEYFNISEKLYNNLDREAVIGDKDLLQDDEVSVERKKKLLSSLAKIDDPLAYRALEAYRDNPDEELVQWSKLALQESKVVLETSLLGEAPIFVSAGMGGKGNSLRYFIALVTNEGLELQDWQISLVKKEFDFVFAEIGGVVEEVLTDTDVIMLTGLLPIAVNIKDTVLAAVTECNQMGNFLMESFIVTNVKKLEADEIRKILTEAGPEENDDVV